MISLTILGDIPSMKNTLRRSRSGAFYHKDDAVRKYKADFAKQVPARHKKKIEGMVLVELMIWQKDRRKDGHNQMATIFDALEFAGVIKNDRQIANWTCCVGFDRNNPRVEIKVGEA